MRKLGAEFLGTFLLVFGGCGSAVFSAAFPDVGIGLLGVSLAFGLTVVAGAYAFGPISGGHFNPAVTLGVFTAGRMDGKDVLPYWVAQLAGGAVAAGLLLFLLQGGPGGYDASVGGLAANGYGEHSPGGFNMIAGFVGEMVLTFLFLAVILGATAKASSPGMAGLVIGLTLTLIHLIGIPLTNLSVNPARSTGPALFVGGWALKQLWLFWVAPLLGGAAGGMVAKMLYPDD